MVAAPGSPVVYVRQPRPRRRKNGRLPPVAPAFGATSAGFRRQLGVTLGQAPRPCLLPGPQPHARPRRNLRETSGPSVSSDRRISAWFRRRRRDLEHLSNVRRYEFPRNLTQPAAAPGPGETCGHDDGAADALRVRVRSLSKRVDALAAAASRRGGPALPRVEAARSLKRMEAELAEARRLVEALEAAAETGDGYYEELGSPDSASTARSSFSTFSMSSARERGSRGSFPLTITGARF